MIVHVDTSFSLVVLVNPRDLAREEDPHVLLHFLGPSFNTVSQTVALLTH